MVVLVTVVVVLVAEVVVVMVVVGFRLTGCDTTDVVVGVEGS